MGPGEEFSRIRRKKKIAKLAISTTTSLKTSASFVSSSLTTTGISFCLSLSSDKSTVDMVGNLDVDYATGLRRKRSSIQVGCRVVFLLLLSYFLSSNR